MRASLIASAYTAPPGTAPPPRSAPPPARLHTHPRVSPIPIPCIEGRERAAYRGALRDSRGSSCRRWARRRRASRAPTRVRFVPSSRPSSPRALPRCRRRSTGSVSGRGNGGEGGELETDRSMICAFAGVLYPRSDLCSTRSRQRVVCVRSRPKTWRKNAGEEREERADARITVPARGRRGVRPREQPARERRPRDRADAEHLQRGEQLALVLAVEERVVALH